MIRPCGPRRSSVGAPAGPCAGRASPTDDRPRRKGLALGAAAALSLGGAGCTLVLDFDQPVIDAAPAGDPYEPNDGFTSARPVELGVIGPLAIAPRGDVDFFRLRLDAPQGLVVTAFTRGAGDLDLRLYDAARIELARATSIGEDERLARTETDGGRLPAGEYTILVYAYDALAELPYELAVATP